MCLYCLGTVLGIKKIFLKKPVNKGFAGQEPFQERKMQNPVFMRVLASWNFYVPRNGAKFRNGNAPSKPLWLLDFLIFVTFLVPKTRSWPGSRVNTGFYVPEIPLILTYKYGYVFLHHTHTLKTSFLPPLKFKKWEVVA